MKHAWKFGAVAMTLFYDKDDEPYLVLEKSYINRKKKITRI